VTTAVCLYKGVVLSVAKGFILLVILANLAQGIANNAIQILAPNVKMATI
jgi:hypothetical protein